MSDERNDTDNVIHVAFGRDGAHRVQPPSAQRKASAERPDRSGDPLADLYSSSEVARLFGYSESRIRYWRRRGFIEPSGRVGRRCYYTFQDLISIRAAKGLLDQGLPFQRVRESVEALRESLPKIMRPLSELRVTAQGQRVVVRDRAGAYEPTTGQRVLDFAVDELREDVVRVLSPQISADRQKTAYEYYLEGCRLDEDDSMLDEAEAAYRRALEIDPGLANAITNLANLRFRRGAVEDAEALYHRAIQVDAEQPEAYYNLGFLYYEQGETEVACNYFRNALRHDPAFADAHFNLATALEELGRKSEAREHWRVYAELEPDGPWAEIARRHL